MVAREDIKSESADRPVIIAMLVGVLCVALLLVASIVIIRSRTGGAAELPPMDPVLEEYLESISIRPFEMIDQNGDSRDNSILAGQYTVLAFTFTNCRTACPIMTSHLLMLHHEHMGLPIRIVTMSVDPARDTPTALAQYAKDRGIDSSRWSLLSGSEDIVRGIIAEDFQFSLYEDPSDMIDLGDAGSMPNIIHPTRFVLLNRNGRPIGLYPGLEPQGIEQVKRDVIALTGSE